MKRNEREMMEEDKYLGIGKKKEVIKKRSGKTTESGNAGKIRPNEREG